MCNRHGEAISLLVLAQCYRAVGNEDQAAKHAQASLDVNESMGNSFGIERAQRFLTRS
jgi:hypothetical protein